MVEKIYPTHWWAEIPNANAPEWEILPHEFKSKKEVILSKRHELGILSNFAPTSFTFHGKRFASIEGFWQMMFYPENENDERLKDPQLQWPHTREEIAMMTGFDAWTAGDLGFKNMQSLGINWVTFEGQKLEYWTSRKGSHYKLIVEAMTEKLKQNPSVREVLLSTGDLILRADHYEPQDSPPSWKYFDIWMDLRSKIQSI